MMTMLALLVVGEAEQRRGEAVGERGAGSRQQRQHHGPGWYVRTQQNVSSSWLKPATGFTLKCLALSVKSLVITGHLTAHHFTVVVHSLTHS